MVAVRAVDAGDAVPLGASLARAFADDPVTNWTFPEAAGRDLGRMFSALMTKVFLRSGLAYTTDDLVGAALWSAPGGWPFSWVQQLRLAPSVLPLLGRHLVKVVRWMRMVDSLHPKEPHWYLAVLGTDPPFQGRGVGSALLEPVITRCDEEGLPSYLESSKESNVPFYRRHGYEVTGVISGFGAPPLYAMWREPRQGGPAGPPR
jgi:GNAT superfamily N-acetyltransferase